MNIADGTVVLEPDMRTYILDESGISYWSKIPALRRREAAMLIVGLDPDKMHIIPTHENPFFDKYNKALRVISRSIRTKSLNSNFNLIDVVELVKLEQHPIYVDERVRSIKRVASYKKKYFKLKKDYETLIASSASFESEPDGLKRSVYGLMLGMAVAAYKYKGSNDENVDNIVRDLEFLGIKQPKAPTAHKQLYNAYFFLKNIDGYEDISDKNFFSKIKLKTQVSNTD